MYFLFIRLAESHAQTHTPFESDMYLNEVLTEYQEPIPGAKARVKKVLRIMLTAWAAAQLKQKAQKWLLNLKENEEKE